MKRNRKMLLAVTATSMVAVAACTPSDNHPVGTVAQPVADAAAGPEQGPNNPPPDHPVGTTASPPDNKK